MGKLASLAIGAALLLGGCQARVSQETPEAGLAQLRDAPTITLGPGPAPAGRFLVVFGGETSNDNRLYQLRLDPLEIVRLTEVTRVSAVGACPDRVVVAAGQAEVGYSDHLQELRGGRLTPLDGLGDTAGFTPAVGPDCRVAYTWVDRTTPALVDELRIWDPAQRAGRTLYRAQPGDGPLISVAWGPEGRLVAVRQGPEQAGELPAGTPAGRPPALVLIEGDQVRDIEVAGSPGVVAWGKRWIAVDDGQGTTFVDMAGGDRPTLPGWRPVAWSPDGEQLLLKDSASRTKLALVNAADLSAVTEIAQLSQPIIDLDWPAS